VLAAQAEAVASVAGSEEPIQYMLRIMNDSSVEPVRRDAMARAAAPYRHAQLQSVAHKHLNADGTPIAPMVTVTIMSVPESRPQLTSARPKDDETVQ
jgi:hypothetical protein